MLEKTIEYNTTQPQNSAARSRESNATSEIEAHGKKCLSYGTILLALTIVNNYAVTCPCKSEAGWPFLVQSALLGWLGGWRRYGTMALWHYGNKV